MNGFPILSGLCVTMDGTVLGQAPEPRPTEAQAWTARPSGTILDGDGCPLGDVWAEGELPAPDPVAERCDAFARALTVCRRLGETPSSVSWGYIDRRPVVWLYQDDADTIAARHPEARQRQEGGRVVWELAVDGVLLTWGRAAREVTP